MTIRHVKRGAEPLRGLIALMGPSNSGKTYTALRLATGIVAVLGGRIALLDTELRGNIYERRFKFERFVMEPPFTPESFMEAYEQLDREFSVVITDNASDEYEGQGGIAEIAANSTLRNEAARWAEPKMRHRRLMSRVRLLKSQHLFLFRASDKIAIEDGEDKQGRPKKVIIPLGWQPHAEKNMLYDFTLAFMLPPNSEGKPEVRKSIEDFEGVFNDGEQITEAHGDAVAKWTKGERVAREPVPVLTPPYRVVDHAGVPLDPCPTLRDALDSYREVKALAGERAGQAAVRNLTLLRYAASRAEGKPELKARLEAEIAAARAAQDGAGELGDWQEPEGPAEQEQAA